MTDNTLNLHNTGNLDFTDSTDKQYVADMTDMVVGMALDGDFSGYSRANVTIKASVRKALKAGQNAATLAMDLEGAIRHMSALTGCMGAKADKADNPVNHTEIVANRAKALIAAGIALFRGDYVPNGLNPEDVDFSDDQEVLDILTTLDNADFAGYLDNPDMSVVEGIATQKVTKSGERVDIAAHVAEVVEGAASGTFFSVRTIAATSTQAAPNGCPSDGAVAMRLFPQKGAKCTLSGVRPASPETDNVPVRGLIVL